MPRSLPALLLGILIAAYWGRVLRLAYKVRKRTGRAANLVPPEPLGKALRVLWYPVVLVWVIHPFVTVFARAPRPPLKPLFASGWIAWPALLVAATCLAGTVACWRRMGQSWRMGIDPAERTPLVATGPFACVRHPIYALSQTMMIASVLVVPSPLMIAAATAHIALLQWEARREEHYLLEVHGHTYAEYCSRVGRFLPKPPSRRRAA